MSSKKEAIFPPCAVTQEEYQAVRRDLFSRFFQMWPDRTDNRFIFPTSCCFTQDDAAQQSRRGGLRPFLDLEKQTNKQKTLCFVFFFLAVYSARLPRCLWPAGSIF